MKIKANQIYYTVESQSWGKEQNAFMTICYLDFTIAVSAYKRFREVYLKVFSSEEKANVMYRLAKVQNGQSITIACCGYGVMDNYTALSEPLI